MTAHTDMRGVSSCNMSDLCMQTVRTHHTIQSMQLALPQQFAAEMTLLVILALFAWIDGSASSRLLVQERDRNFHRLSMKIDRSAKPKHSRRGQEMGGRGGRKGSLPQL